MRPSQTLITTASLILTLILMIQSTTAQEISFWEEFALSADRVKTLEQLVPGSEDYYFFHCMHYQNQEQLDEVESMLKKWIKRNGRTELVQQIENRQALLRYSEDPNSTLKFLTDRLNLNFNHQRQIPSAQRDLPTKLNSALVDIKKLISRELNRDSNSLRRIEDDGLILLGNSPLNTRQRRELLNRLSTPDFPKLVDLISKDLKQKDSKGFGPLKVHRLLTREQMDLLVAKVPELRTKTNFVYEYLIRLQPNEDIDWRVDPVAKRKYFNRVWDYANTLNDSQSFRSLKACVLYHILELDLEEDKPNKKRFLEYLAMPRNVNYLNPDFLKQSRRTKPPINLSDNFANYIRINPINNDEPLVREYLQRFLATATDTKAFDPFLESKFLKQQFATAKILNGKEDRERWASMLTPEQYESLRQRIDIDFHRTNPEFFAVDDAVELKLFTKNIDKLIVKVFEINTENYYKRFGKEIDTDISLDGLVANHEQSLEFDDSPFLRKLRSVKIDQIKKRGVYVVDFIGGGKSSRALIRKGRLQMVGQTILRGQRFNVINESGAVVKDGSLWIAGRKYDADKDGHIDVPFSTQPSRKNAIISQGDFSCLQMFDQVAENYDFRASFFVDRETLTRGTEAEVLIRPSLRVSSAPIPVALIKNARLEIKSENLDGITTTKTIDDVQLTEKGEAVAQFNVPPRLNKITFTLFGELENSANKKKSFSARETFAINNIDRSDEIQDVHLLPTSTGYYLEVLGKTGEVRVKQPVRVQLNVFGLKQHINIDLQSDKNGLIELGELGSIESIKATVAGGSTRDWNLRTAGQHLYRNYHILSGEILRISLPNDIKVIERPALTLYEVRANRYVRDCFDKVDADQGSLNITGLEPGNYELRFRSRQLSGRTEPIKIRVIEGQQAANVLAGKKRFVEDRRASQPYIYQATSKKDTVKIQLENVTNTTRVHVFTSRYHNAFDPFHNFASIRAPEPWVYTPSIRRSAYMEGRKIGEEYQYILKRRYLKRYPGNMLERPSLLLNPWAVQDTDNKSQVAQLGDKFDVAGMDADQSRVGGAAQSMGAQANNDFANVDFLGSSVPTLINVQPDKDGSITLTKEQIGDAQNIMVVAVDAFSVATTKIHLPLKKLSPYDHRLANAIDPDKHFSQTKQIKLLGKGEMLTIEDLISSRVQPYDELSDVFELYKTFGRDSAKLQTFEFVLDWLDKTQEEKQSLYSKHACHELSFFIKQKDASFFKAVVLPHLENKREKTFVDHYLLDEDLTEFLAPWKFARLNVVERILLAQRLEEHRGDLVRNIEDMYAISPTPRLEFDRLYDSAMAGLSMDNGRMRLKRKATRFSRGDDESDSSFGMDGMSMDEGLALGGAVVMGGGMGGSGGGNFGEMGGEAAPAPAAEQPSRGRGKKRYFSKDDKSKAPGKQLAKRQQKESKLGEEREELSRLSNLSLIISDGEQLLEEQNEMLLEKMKSPMQPLYRRVDPTREWMENNYYHLLPTQQNDDLVRINRFWRDYANHQTGDFLSAYFAEANHNFTEMMFAISVLDLPLKDAEEDIEFADGKMNIKAAQPLLVLHQQNVETPFERGETKLLVSENFFQKNDRYRYDGSVQYDKFITGEFLAHTLYGAQVVLTNPTSTPMSVELLSQIPAGAMASSGSQETRTVQFELAAFSTQRFEYSFYFPTAGNFSHYPAHVSSEEKVVAAAEDFEFKVIDEPAKLDETSWAFVSQNGSEDDVIEFLNDHNVLRLNLDSIAFRLQDKSFFERAIETLRRRHTYNHTLWAYSVKHNDEKAISEFLSHADQINQRCGMAFDSPILTIDPVERNWFEHREYWPLVNARAHQLGPQRKILNPNFFAQYNKLMNVLANKPKLDSEDHLVVTYYMLLQDRIEAGLEHFEQVRTDSVNTKLQRDYCDAYLDLYRENPDRALSIAQKWADYPVDHWRAKFENVIAMVNEINGGETAVIDRENQNQQQTALASKSASFDFEIESRRVKVNYQNLKDLRVNYYEMDIELLFSRNPFSRDQLDGFSLIRPNRTANVELVGVKDATEKGDEGEQDLGKGYVEFELPAEFQNKNVLIELVGGDKTKSQAYFANSLDVQVLENYGQVHVTKRTEDTAADSKSEKSDGNEAKEPNRKRAAAVSKAYVKVYARRANGQIEFHKDGYTDLRGRFDFVSQSNRSLDGITDYSVLIMSDELGAVIKEAKPPLE